MDTAYAGFWKRGIITSIDWTLLMLASYLFQLVFGNALLGNILYQIFALIYYVILLSSTLQGTLGNYLLSTHVQTKEGERLSPFHALARYLVMMAPFIPPVIFLLLPKTNAFLMAISTAPDLLASQRILLEHHDTLLALQIISVLMTVMAFIWYLPIAFTKQKTGIHDIICKTRVVNGRLRQSEV